MVDTGRTSVVSVGTSGAVRNGAFGAFLNGESSSLAVQVEFSNTGDDIIGLALLPGFGGGNAGATDVLFVCDNPLLNELFLNEWYFWTGFVRKFIFGAITELDQLKFVLIVAVGTGGGGFV